MTTQTFCFNESLLILLKTYLFSGTNIQSVFFWINFYKQGTLFLIGFLPKNIQSVFYWKIPMVGLYLDM